MLLKGHDMTASRTAHEDVIKWKHFPLHWPFVRGIHRSPMNSPHKGQWRRALMFSLFCAGKSGWVHTCEAGGFCWNSHCHWLKTLSRRRKPFSQWQHGFQLKPPLPLAKNLESVPYRDSEANQDYTLYPLYMINWFTEKSFRVRY